MEKKNLLIGLTGSVATIKLPSLIASFEQNGHITGSKFEIKIVATANALRFINFADIGTHTVHRDEDEWDSWHKRGDKILHIELAKWADVMVLAPLNANSMAKLANGICDNLLLCTTRAWDFQKPIFFCPAMNTRMFNHPVTAQQIDILKSWGYREIPCISKELMCGENGMGGMAETENIAIEVCKVLKNLELL